MRKTMIVVLGVMAFGALSLSALAYDYPDPTGFDIHNYQVPSYNKDYPIFIHDAKVWDYTGSWPGDQAWINTARGDYPWHERNLTNTRGMYPIQNGGEGEFYWHGWKDSAHYVSNQGNGPTHWNYGPWLHEEVPTPSDPVYLEFYLGGLYPLDEMWIHPYAHAGTGTYDTATYDDRSARHVTIKYKRNIMDAWTTLGNFEFGVPPAGNTNAYGGYGADNQFGPSDDPNDTYRHRAVDFGNNLIRYVQFEITSNWGDGQFVGLNEIRFYVEGSAYILYPTRIIPSSANHFGPVNVGGKSHQLFSVVNAGSAGSAMLFNQVDISLLPGTGFSILNPIAPGTDLTGSPIGGAPASADLGTIVFSPPDMGEYTGNVLLRYTDAFGPHLTTVTVQGTGRHGTWGSLFCKSDQWRSHETWDGIPGLGTWRNTNGTNMNDPGKGISGSRKGTVGRYDPVLKAGQVWGWGSWSAYYGWRLRRWHWFIFDFEQSVNIDEMLFWNTPHGNAGLKDVLISYTNEAVPHHGDPQDEPPPVPGSYISFYTAPQAGCWTNAYGHFSGLEDTRYTLLPGTNRSAERTGAHMFAPVGATNWRSAPESIDFGGVTARQVRFDILHNGVGSTVYTAGPTWGLQGSNSGQPTNPSGYGSYGNDRILVSQVRFYSGGPYPELKFDLPEASGSALRSSANFYNMAPFAFPTQYYPFITTSTALHIGNIGDVGTSIDVTDVSFADMDGDGTPDPGPFSIDLGSVTLPKTYAAGSTDSLGLVWAPLKQLGSSEAKITITATSGGVTKKGSMSIMATAMAVAPGYITSPIVDTWPLQDPPILRVASLSPLEAEITNPTTTGNWCAASAYDRTNFKEDPVGVVGSKGGKSLRNAWATQPLTGKWDWPGWLDGLYVSGWLPGGYERPPLEDPHWLEIDLGSPKTLDEMYIYNHQQGGADNFFAALKDIYIEYKLNVGDAWTRLGGQAYRVHSWYHTSTPAAHPVEAPPANQLNTHDPFKFPAATQAQFVRIVAAGPVGDADPNQVGLWGSWGRPETPATPNYYWGCADIALYEPAPAISLSTTTLEYGAINTATTLDRTVTISNTGNGPMQVSDVIIEGTAVPYTVVGSKTFPVAAGASAPLTIRFAPTARGDYSNVRVVIVNTASYFSFVTLNGIGRTAGSAYTVASPAGGGTINYGDTNVNQPKNRYVVLKNLGDTALTVTSVGVVGSTAFTAPGTYPLVIAANGGEEKVPLVCTPPAVGDYAGVATLSLTGDTAVPTLTYSLTANGVLAPPAMANGEWIKYY